MLDLKVTAISPNTTTDCRTEALTITGTRFEAGAQAGFDGPVSVPVEGVRVVNETTITGGTPSGMRPGTYDVVVTNPGGQIARLPKAYVVQGCRRIYRIEWSVSGGYSLSWEQPKDRLPPDHWTVTDSLSYVRQAEIDTDAPRQLVTSYSVTGVFTGRDEGSGFQQQNCGGPTEWTFKRDLRTTLAGC